MNERDARCSIAFGNLMRDARELKGLTQMDAAEQLGISQSYYHRLEKGERAIDLSLALRVTKLLGINLTGFIRNFK